MHGVFDASDYLIFKKSRALAADASISKRWTRHGSTRYLWRVEDVEMAIRYTVDEQGEPMEVFEDGSESDSAARPCHREAH